MPCHLPVKPKWTLLCTQHLNFKKKSVCWSSDKFDDKCLVCFQAWHKPQPDVHQRGCSSVASFSAQRRNYTLSVQKLILTQHSGVTK